MRFEGEISALTGKRAVLLDLDGVLVHTERLKAQAHSAAVRRFGGAEVPLSYYAEVIGQSHEQVRSAYFKVGAIYVDPSVYTRAYREIYRDILLTDLELRTGSVALLRRLSQKGYALAVVSSSDSRAMDQILTQTQVIEFFDVLVSGDDVDRKKPAPDAYLLALELLAIPSTFAVVIEDSEAGIQAAVNAGIPALAVRHSMNFHHDFSPAYIVLDSLRNTCEIVQAIDRLLGIRSRPPIVEDEKGG